MTVASMTTRVAQTAVVGSLILAAVGPAASNAQAVYSKEIYSGRYAEHGGEAIYQAICQGCHMAGGEGASGAGAYPALANDPRLKFAAYPLSVVANGQKAMPWFAGALTDQQIADVVAYVRTHFGNHFDTPVSPQEVAAVRRPHPADGE
jgi:mono/diheme cytochrome c family protein